MLKLLMITKDPDIASYAIDCGVDIIFLDLEFLGKVERQGHLNTVISRHTLADLEEVRQVTPKNSLITRINPFHYETSNEIDAVINAGTDYIMLPMFKCAAELHAVSECINGRTPLIPLVETPQAMIRLQEIIEVQGLEAIYIGLNDLHLGLGLDFMFEPLGYGYIDNMANIINTKGLPFGFGGLGRMDTTPLPGTEILAEHVRLGSNYVILSRSFHGNARTIEELRNKINLAKEIKQLRAKEKEFGSLSSADLLSLHQKTSSNIMNIARNIRAQRNPLPEYAQQPSLVFSP